MLYLIMRTMVTLNCKFCGKEFQVQPSRAKHGRGKHCSPACQYATKRAMPKAPRVKRVCLNCGTTFELLPSTFRDHIGVGKYCKRKCRDEHRVGKNHPQSITGDRDPRYKHGANWQAQRRKARKRDNRICQHCNEKGQDVHHIKPFRLFDSYKDANVLSNLVTLCKPCHRKADAAYQQVTR